jgi:hypothetical protein
MGTSLLIAIAALALGAPAGPPDGRLVLSIAGHTPGGSGAVTREWAAVFDPRDGSLRRRRLAGGTLCIAPVVARRGRVLFGGYRGRRPVTLSLPLTLRGRARVEARRLPRWTAARLRVAVPAALPLRPGERVLSVLALLGP